MKLLFSVQGQNFVVRVDEERNLFFSSSFTNNKELSFHELASQPGNDPSEVELAEFIVKNLKDEETVAEYVIKEFTRKGLEHVDTVV